MFDDLLERLGTKFCTECGVVIPRKPIAPFTRLTHPIYIPRRQGFFKIAVTDRDLCAECNKNNKIF